MKNPKVSIITVSYNSEKFIENTIKSVLNQDYKNVEYIIVDGNSVDNTINVIEKYRKFINKIIIESDNGIYDALNKGIMRSTGDIIGVLHSDDYYHDDKVITRIVKKFNLYDVDAVYSNSIFVNQTGNIIRKYSSQRFKIWKMRFGFMPSHPTFYCKSEILQNNPLYDTNFTIAADFELLLRLLVKIKISTKYIDDTWVIMREGGVSTKDWRNKLRISKEILSGLKKNRVYSNSFLVSLRFVPKAWERYIIKSKV